MIAAWKFRYRGRKGAALFDRFYSFHSKKNPTPCVLCLLRTVPSPPWPRGGMQMGLAKQCEQRNLLFSLFAFFQTKVGGTSHTGGSFEEVLSSTAHASAQSSLAGTRLPESEEELQC